MTIEYDNNLKATIIGYTLMANEELLGDNNDVSSDSSIETEGEPKADEPEPIISDEDIALSNSQELNIYGKYEFDDGDNAIMTAEVMFATGDGMRDIISITGMSYGDRYISEFAGELINVEGNLYEAESEQGTKLLILFTDNGMIVEIESLGLDDDAVLEGEYIKTKSINFDEVG